MSSHATVPTASVVNTLSKLLILFALAACGAPGSEQVFTKVGQKAPEAVAVRKGPPPAIVAAKRFEGFYSRLGEESKFQPCGAKVPLDVTGSGEARYLLHERFRWTSPWQGQKMFAVFMGSIVTDTPRVKGRAGPDTAARAPRTIFFITAVESLRTVEPEDCGGKR